MVSVQTRNYCPLFWWAQAVIGSSIYMIGECINGAFSSKVFFIDCRSHTWHETPSMQMARKIPLVSVLDGKIYVVKGCKHPNSSNFIECFDPKTQICEYVPSLSAEIHRGYRSISRSLAFEGKLYQFGDESYLYKPKEKKWDVLGLLERDVRLAVLDNSCVIDNVIYYYAGYELLLWYDLAGKRWTTWRALQGLEKPKLPPHVRLVDYGGKLRFCGRRMCILQTPRTRFMGRLSGVTLCLHFPSHEQCLNTVICFQCDD